MTDPERIRRLLGGADLAWIVDRARHRMERGQPLTGRVTLRSATPPERAAAARLLGSALRPGAQLSVDLAAVDAVLRRSGAAPEGLPAAVVVLGGEVTDLIASAANANTAWEEVFAQLEADPRPELVAWREGLRSSGLVRRLAGAPEAAGVLLADTARVVAALPANGEPRGHLAARVLGHAHALDDGKPLTTLVFQAARMLGDSPDGRGARWRRTVWEAAGVLPDDLSSSVLALGLPGSGGSPLGRVLQEWRTAGEPVSLTLRQVRRPGLIESLGVHAGHEVFVCENPVIVSMTADRWGPESAPLICVNGQPGVAVQVMLQALVTAGVQLRYHGDFDWGGLRIANRIMSDYGAQPWRMNTASYQDAAARGLGRELTGTPVDAAWEPALASTMLATGRGIDEEHVAHDLLTDLRTPSRPSGGASEHEQAIAG